MNISKIVLNIKREYKNITNEMICSSLLFLYCRDNKINYIDNGLLKNEMENHDIKLTVIVDRIFKKNNLSISLDTLIDFFEYKISATDKKNKGIVYTPKIIKNLIVKNSLAQFSDIPIVCDPSCGCGSFLLTAAQFLHKKYNLNYFEIFSKYIYGMDIEGEAIKSAKILFSLFLLKNNENQSIEFKLYQCNSLKLDNILYIMKKIGTKFDCILGNPPYVRYRNIDNVSKKYMLDFESASCGNVDLYMPFYELAFKMLKKGGVCGYITPNNFFQAVNGRSLRNYFLKNCFELKIIDFRDEQIFNDITSYTCICIVRDNGLKRIKYARSCLNEIGGNIKFDVYALSKFSIDEPWRLFGSNNDRIIYKLENSGTKLSNWGIKNGLATLNNDIYFFTPCEENCHYFFRIYNGARYKIEKEICLDIVKPNIVKTEDELLSNNEKAIFPYRRSGNEFKIIGEDYMKEHYPFAYNFLLLHKNILDSRDKGKGDYPIWYAYGRTQGMKNFGKKILIPYMSGNATAVISTNPDLLYYCGYALFEEDIKKLKVLKIFLESDAFWFYVKQTSKPYSKGYMSLAKNYIKNFTIPDLQPKEIDYLLKEKNNSQLNKFIWLKYNIDF